MKMRIQGDMIRFRLNRREVADFETAGRIASAIDFPDGRRLSYALVATGSKVEAAFDGGEVSIRLPRAVADEWTGTGRTGIEQRITLGADRHLDIIVEKDFQCMHKGEADKDPEAYPNPMAAESA